MKITHTYIYTYVNKSQYNSQDWKAACKGYNAFEIRIPKSRTARETNESSLMERMRRGREGGMMADGGGTFRCATMLCGNNAQTNDSAVPTVITRGTRSFFPLLNPLSQPPSNQLSFYVYPFVPLSFLVSLVHLPIHVYTGLPLSLSLSRTSHVPRPLPLSHCSDC